MIRPISFPLFLLFYTVFSVAVFNGSFFDTLLGRIAYENFSDWLFSATLVGIVVGIHGIFSLLLMWPFTTKPIAVLLLLGNASALYFMQQFQVVIEQSMIENALDTDWREASDLLNPKLVSYLLILGVFPSLLLCRTPIVYPPFLRNVLGRIMAIVIIAVVMGLGVFLQFKDISTHMRLHNHAQDLWVPRNYLWSLYKSLRQSRDRSSQELIPLGEDARYTPNDSGKLPGKLIVVVIGETARAKNFSLYGYGRETNPKLSERDDLLVLPRTEACGTSTKVSVPCMFSALDRQSYADYAGRLQYLPALLARLGIGSTYIGNNFGDCKGICEGMATEYTHDKFDHRTSRFCTEFECRDEILIDRLQQYLSSLKEGDQLLLLHQNGSHGPRYNKRVPEAFQYFVPVCDSADIRQCSQQELINSYDNTIVYTDHVLSALIAELEASSRASVLIYLSDHGESLGEKGLYLHGLPHAIAPKEQTEVPFLMWFSPEYRAAYPLDAECLVNQKDYRHAHLFHSLAGLFGVEMSEYDQELDLFATCGSFPASH